MKTSPNRFRIPAFVLLTIVFFWACASTSYIGIDYRLPASAAKDMSDSRIHVRIEDQRPATDTLSPQAREDFEHFTGLFSLSVERPGQKPMLMGAFDVSRLFANAFEKRLEAANATVVKEPGPQTVTLNIVLKEFSLERQGRQYTAALSYRAGLSHPDGKSVSQSIKGNAERIKITGKRDMEKLLGEIFTDMVNRLDIAELFAEAGY